MRKYLFLPLPAMALLAASAAHDPARGDAVAVGDTSTIEQIGEANSASVDQDFAGALSGNASEIYQGNGFASSNNAATVQQRAAGGAKNYAYTSQGGANNQAATYQNTDATNSGGAWIAYSLPSFTFTNSQNQQVRSVADGTDPQPPGGFSSWITQTGDGNIAFVSQGILDGAAATSKAISDVMQTGGSYVEVNQWGASNNASKVTQDNSTATINQDGNLNFTNVSVLEASAGSNDNVNQHAYRGNNTSYIDQAGGTVNVTQTAWRGGNSSAVEQVGGTATVTQNIHNSASGGTDNSIIWQSGGVVTVTQDVFTSGLNASDITQTGGQATVNQMAKGGADNSTIRSIGGVSSVTQTASLGFTNESSIIQSGSNSATVTQSMAHIGGDNTSTIEQTLMGGSTQNQATVEQTANYGANISHIIQTGYGNVAIVKQR